MNKGIFIVLVGAIMLNFFSIGFMTGNGWWDKNEQKALVGMAYKIANTTYECTDEDGNLNLIDEQIFIKSSTEGENGKFTDYCEQGDLDGVREFFCATDQVQSILKGCNCIDGACIE